MHGISTFISLIQISPGGPCTYQLEWYRDDDGGSGYGDEAEVQYWYGTREECEAWADGAAPLGGWIDCSFIRY